MPGLFRRTLARTVATSLLIAIVASTAGCAPAPQPEQTGMLAPDPNSALGLPALIGLEPILKPETHVLSDDELAGLDSVQVLNPEVCLVPGDDRPPCEFELLFTTPPADHDAGTVLAAGVTPASPDGLLVTVTSTFEDSGWTVVEATEATLGDALEQGEFLIELQFEAADVEHVELAPGVTAAPASAALGGGGDRNAPATSRTVGGGLAFNYVIDAEIITGVKATGEVGFDIGCGAYGGLTWKKVLGVPVYPNGVYFEAKCGASQKGAITLTGSAGLEIDKHYQLAVVNLSAITFFVGPLPVVLVPKIIVSIDATGKIAASMSVGASEHFSATVGINYSDGFHLIKEFDSGFEKNVTTGSSRLSLNAGVTLSQALLLYGVAGPQLNESLYLDLVGKPPGQKPIWCLKAGLKGTAQLGIDLGIKYLGWGPGELFNWSTELGCAGNSKPKIDVFSPDDGQTVYPNSGGLSIEFNGNASDDEDGGLPITWTSSKDGVLGTTKPGKSLPIGDLSLGTHTITATTTDGDGASASVTFSLVVKDGSPTVGFVAKDSSGDWYGITSITGDKGGTAYFRLKPKSPVPLVVPTCDKVSWSSSLTVTRVANCDFKVALSKEGTFPATVTLTDPQGKTATATLTVKVGPAPAVIKPAFGPISVTADGGAGSVEDGGVLVSWVTGVTAAIDYENSGATGKKVRYAWSYRYAKLGSSPGAWTTLGSTDAATLGGSSRAIPLINGTTSQYGYDIRVVVTDASSGATVWSDQFHFDKDGEIH